MYIENESLYKVIPNTKIWGGIEIIARYRENEFYLVSWEKEWDEKVKKAIYEMEQDEMFGIYKDNYKSFSETWEMGEYEAAGSVVFKKSEVEIIKEYKGVDYARN